MFGDDYCALDCYLENHERFTVAIHQALTAIESPLTPRKIKEAMIQLARDGTFELRRQPTSGGGGGVG